MSDETARDDAAAQSMAALVHLVSNEGSRDGRDSADGWVGYESAFPFPVGDLAEVGRWFSTGSGVFV